MEIYDQFHDLRSKLDVPVDTCNTSEFLLSFSAATSSRPRCSQHDKTSDCPLMWSIYIHIWWKAVAYTYMCIYFVYIYIHTCIHTYVYTHTLTHRYIPKPCKYIHTYSCCIYIDLHVTMHMYMYCMYIYIYNNIHTYMYTIDIYGYNTYTYAYIYLYLHVHNTYQCLCAHPRCKSFIGVINDLYAP